MLREVLLIESLDMLRRGRSAGGASDQTADVQAKNHRAAVEPIKRRLRYR